MKNRCLVLTIGTAVLAGMAVSASAQDNKPVGLSVRIGLFTPTDAVAKAAGQSWLAFGADYKLRDVVMKGGKHPGEISLSMDYASKGGFRVLPILLNYTSHWGDAYVTVGAGVSFTAAGGTDSSKFGYTAALGYNFHSGNNPLFVEAKFLGNEQPQLNGFAFYIGTRL